MQYTTEKEKVYPDKPLPDTSSLSTASLTITAVKLLFHSQLNYKETIHKYREVPTPENVTGSLQPSQIPKKFLQ